MSKLTCPYCGKSLFIWAKEDPEVLEDEGGIPYTGYECGNCFATCFLDKYKLEEQENLIPPAPHYPNWRYLCPRCWKYWENSIYRADFRLICPDCR